MKRGQQIQGFTPSSEDTEIDCRFVMMINNTERIKKHTQKDVDDEQRTEHTTKRNNKT